MFVKWAGGKKQLLEQFSPMFPEKVERYFEPFVGGGAVAFHIIKSKGPKKVLISDNNEELINAYLVVRDNVDELITLLRDYRKKHSKETYYKVRMLNTSLLSPIERAARFIYLNKTCFNGLYRVNSGGKFNVPMGNYKNPSICSESDLREISRLLQGKEIMLMSFENVLRYAKSGDFVYFDPPYYPLKSGSFTTYTKDNFLEEEQKALAETFKKLDSIGCKVMLSNSDTNFVRELYKNFNITTVKASRMINCNGSGRGKVNEVVVTNYKNKSYNLSHSWNRINT